MPGDAVAIKTVGADAVPGVIDPAGDVAVDEIAGNGISVSGGQLGFHHIWPVKECVPQGADVG